LYEFLPFGLVCIIIVEKLNNPGGNMLPKIKEPAPLFELPDEDGKIHKLVD
jgi:hypothetical protein